MYSNLEKELKAKGISINAAAAAIGMPEPTFRGKMSIKEREFSVSEAMRIKRELFPEMDFMYLFPLDEDEQQ